MIEAVVRYEFEQRGSCDSAETLAARIVDNIDVAEASRAGVLARVASEIRQGPSAYSSLGSDYDDEAILETSAEDVIAYLEGFVSGGGLTDNLASPHAVRPHDRSEADDDLPSCDEIADLCDVDIEAIRIKAKGRNDFLKTHVPLYPV